MKSKIQQCAWQAWGLDSMIHDPKKLTMSLNKLLAGFANSALIIDTEVCGLANDNRKVKPGYLFFACRGLSVHGKDFISAAIAAGATAIALETDSVEEALEISVKHGSIPVIAINDLSDKLGFIASRFYDDPSKQFSLIGITGTNGKTSVAHLTAQCLNSKQHACGVLGTLGAGVWGNVQAIQHTTPDALELQYWLFKMHQQSAAYVAMEVSSHGLDQGRVNACQFDVAVFTNLTRDHLDYHGDIQSYGNSKLKLFKRPELTKVVVNLDDPYTNTIISNLSSHVDVVGITLNPGLKVEGVKVVSAMNICMGQLGLEFDISSPWGDAHLQSHLLGDFNVSNLLSVLAVALLLDFPLQDVVEKLSNVRAPAGRLESFGSDESPLVVVDYAHTPDALEKVLLTLQAHAKGKLFVLFGCGGDRDQGKRAKMGALAEKIADVVWLTDDNPRTEKSQRIIEDILVGIKNPQLITVNTDRRGAIEGIISAANSADDIVLIAGKGHEDYQIIGNERIDFSDRELVAQLVSEAA